MTPIPTGFPPIDQGWFGIWYQPLSDEIDPASLAIVRERGLKPGFVMPTDKNAKPEEVLRLIKTDKPVYLFIPGTKFDVFGTRHGRGGGWYDRFLALAPREWVRVGVARREQMSETELIRQEWDQGMDWVVVGEDGSSH